MSRKVVRTGHIEIGSNDDVLEAMGIGSCVVLCLYDRTKKLGGLAHIMLPKKQGVQDNDNEAKAPAIFVDQGASNLVKYLTEKGAEQINLEAKIFGGAEMFENIRAHPESLGSINIKLLRDKLNNLGIKIINEDTGGKTGRSVKFYIDNGDVEVRKKL